MKFKLKYGPNFSLSDGNQVFSITDTTSKGIIEVVTTDDPTAATITGYQFLLTHNGTALYPQPRSKN